jgi:hypothetical protein
MGLFDWLFGKSDKPAAAPAAERAATPAPVATAERSPTPAALPPNPGSTPEGSKPRAQPVPPRPAAPEPTRAEAPEVRNLKRWKESGQPRTWVEARNGHWGHADWLGLLDTLKRSELWPMQPDAIGLALEEAKRDWLQRRTGAPVGR